MRYDFSAAGHSVTLIMRNNATVVLFKYIIIEKK